MFKHTQTIRRLLPTNCWNVFDLFVELALKELKKLRWYSLVETVASVYSNTILFRTFRCQQCAVVSDSQWKKNGVSPGYVQLPHTNKTPVWNQEM